jgi:biotin carboxyl carrier protein
MHHAFKIGDAEHNVELSRARSGYRLHVGDRVVPVDLKTGADGHLWLTVSGSTSEVFIAQHGDKVFVHLVGEVFELEYEHPLERLAHQGHGAADDQVQAPMPGSIVQVHVKAGDKVTKGQTVLIMESMKMETTIVAPRDGLIAAIRFEKGQTFDRDAVLVALEPVT